MIGMMAGSSPSIEKAIERLKRPGGERTADWLVGPAAKQRYMDAYALTDKMKAGMGEAERIGLARQLGDLLKNGYVRPEEGEVQHFVLLALGRVWQIDPGQGKFESPAAKESRRQTMDVLMQHAQAKELQTRKAAILAVAFWKGYDEARQAVPMLVERVRDGSEDLDVRLAASTVLGPIGSANDGDVIEALQFAMRNAEPRERELVWSAALSLAQLGSNAGEETLLKLMDRGELATIEFYDRETDPKNPRFRTLNEPEQQRILINAMEGVRNLKSEAVRRRVEEMAKSDPSRRVRLAAEEVLRQTDGR